MRTILQRLFAAWGEPYHLWQITFTVGKDMREKIPRNNLARLNQIGYQSLNEYFDGRWKFPVKFFYDGTAQFWSSEHPESGFLPHIHASVPRLFVEAKTGRLLRNVNKMKYIEEDSIKRIWRKRVEAEYGKSKAFFASKVTQKTEYEYFSVTIDYQAARKGVWPEKEFDHWFRYQYRGVSYDFEKRLFGGVSDENVAKWDRAWAQWCLSAVHKRHQGYGLFAPNNFKASGKLMQQLGLDLGTKRERGALRGRKRCAVCGGYCSGDSEVELLTLKDAAERGIPLWRNRHHDESKKFNEWTLRHAGER